MSNLVRRPRGCIVLLMNSTDLKQQVREFWNARSCGEVYATGDGLRQQLVHQANARIELEPYIPGFAKFDEGRDKNVLEIGCGMGADHLEWARARPQLLVGIDLTDRSVEFTRSRFALYEMHSRLLVADAENLPFPDNA